MVSYADDGTVGKVPRKNIVEDKDIVIGETYFVHWSDGKKYSAEVLFIGKNVVNYSVHDAVYLYLL